jgi:hypothetical protein
VAYEIRNGASYLLASESWTWAAFPYHQHIADVSTVLGKNLGQAAQAEEIGAAWLANNVAALGATDNYPYTFSLVDLSKMPALSAKQNSLADALIAAFKANEAQTRKRMDAAFTAAECVDSDQDGRIEHHPTIGWADNYCDLGTFAAAIGTAFSGNGDVTNAAQGVLQALDDTVLANAFRSGTPHFYSQTPWEWSKLSGLTIYLPLGQDDDWKRRYYSEPFLPTSADSRWDELLAEYRGGAPPPADPDCSEGCSLPPPALPVVGVAAAAVKVDGGIRVEWQVSAASATIAEYEVVRVQPSPPVTATFASSSNSYLDSSATDSYEYCYRVTALDPAGGDLGSSNLTCAVGADNGSARPLAPRISDTGTGLLVEWGTFQARTVSGYRVYRSENRGRWLPQTDALLTETWFVDNTVAPNAEYCYRVHTLGPNGEQLAVSEHACASVGEPRLIFLPSVHRGSAQE